MNLTQSCSPSSAEKHTFTLANTAIPYEPQHLLEHGIQIVCKWQVIFIDESNIKFQRLYPLFHFDDQFSKDWQFWRIEMGNPSKLPLSSYKTVQCNVKKTLWRLLDLSFSCNLSPAKLCKCIGGTAHAVLMTSAGVSCTQYSYITFKQESQF